MIASFPEIIHAPFRRIFATWGVIMLVGFILSGLGYFQGYLHWYPLIIVGLIVQALPPALTMARPLFLFVFWLCLVGGALIYTQQVFTGGLPYPNGIPRVEMAWLFLLAIGQMVTGIVCRQNIEVVIGVIWAIIAVIFWSTTSDIQTAFIAIALLTSLPYFFLALKK